MSAPSIIHPWVSILLALAVSYVVFGGSALAFALDPDDRMITRAAWSLLQGYMQHKG